ncbi:TIGR02300 family protein [Aggregicoccus sp. 17bor-14]|uniref:FYDLN acid domain-containing protein n=1 Tax=Myxococcaceae TaxID=31 RepID=UPI00129C8CDD|nr:MULTISPECIES: FYDLN acid domain-containing protein [Myxococcaceae]MBF5044299.1 FYDLN acid domain-containing protein [Simulacricoccus sp. 17bor-14]MRI90048.1 TIGR02300 family protein [Aggregicoccus sp. 17bor-14]
MPAKDLGNKFVCFKCSTKFYDMKKPDPICPKCGADQRESPALKPASEGRRGRLAAVPKVIEPIEPAEEPEAAAEEEEDLDSFDDEETETAAADDEDI